MARRLPDAELVVFEDSAHMTFVEENDRYLATVRRFLEPHHDLTPPTTHRRRAPRTRRWSAAARSRQQPPGHPAAATDGRICTPSANAV